MDDMPTTDRPAGAPAEAQGCLWTGSGDKGGLSVRAKKKEPADALQDGLRVVVDTREQAPYAFSGAACYEGTTVEQGALSTGDYSLKGFEDFVSVERKSLPDFVACLGRERERFARELSRARGLEAFAVVVEGTFADLARHDYRGLLNAHSACQSVCAFMARWHIPILFAGTRDGGQYAVWSFLRQWLRGKRHELKALEKAMGASWRRPKAAGDNG